MSARKGNLRIVFATDLRAKRTRRVWWNNVIVQRKYV